MFNRRSVLSLGSAALVTAGTAPSTVLAQDAETPVITDMMLGNPDADVTVIEYASFTCPHCANFHANVMPQFKENYLDTGKVNFQYREVYFDRPGLWAAMVARCGGEMRYFAIVDMVFSKQKEWMGDRTPAVMADGLRKIGLAAGLGAEEIEACLNDQAMAEAMFAHFQKNMEEYEVSGTPAIVVNGNVIGAVGYDALEAELSKHLTN